MAANLFNLCWTTWKGRNRFVFEQIAANPAVTIETAGIASFDPKLAISSDVAVNFSVFHRSHPSHWQPPPIDFVKINVGTTSVEDKGRGAVEVTVRNSDGAFVSGVARQILASSCLMVEAVASREAIILAHALSLNMLPLSQIIWRSCLMF